MTGRFWAQYGSTLRGVICCGMRKRRQKQEMLAFISERNRSSPFLVVQRGGEHFLKQRTSTLTLGKQLYFYHIFRQGWYYPFLRRGTRIRVDSDGRDSNNDLFPGQPPTLSASRELLRIIQWFNKLVVNVMKKDVISSRLQFLKGDTRHSFEALIARPEASGGWRVMNPFNDIYRLVYCLTMRMLGSFEIAEDPKLLDYTMSVFEQFEKYSGPSNIIFPWLPTRDSFGKLYLSFRLFWIFRGIVKQRERTGNIPADTVQYLLDSGSSIQQVVTVSFYSTTPSLGIDTSHSLRLPRFLPAKLTAG
jgi:hypothetical protein